MNDLNNRIFQFTDYKEILNDEFTFRANQKKKYSLRTFSKELGLRETMINDVLNGRYGLSGDSARTIAKNLQLDQKATDYFLCLVELMHARSSAAKKNAKLKFYQYNSSQAYTNIAVDALHIISHWHHFAIVELITIHKQAFNVDFCTKALGITRDEVTSALERLERCKVIEKKDQNWVRLTDHFQIDEKTPSMYIREFHKQMLSLAYNSVENQSRQERCLLSSIVGIDSKHLPEYFRKLDQLHLDFGEKLDGGTKSDQVYGLTFQLYRIDRDTR